MTALHSHPDLHGDTFSDRVEQLAFIAGSSAAVSAALSLGALTYGSTIGTTFTVSGVVAMVVFLFLLSLAIQVLWKVWNSQG